MTERQLLSEFLKQFGREHPDIFYHKEADVYGGAKKPYDWYFIYKGKHFAIEAKRDNGKVEQHQKEALTKVAASGGSAWVMRFNEKPKRVIFLPFKEMQEQPAYIYLHWWRGWDGIYKIPMLLNYEAPFCERMDRGVKA